MPTTIDRAAVEELVAVGAQLIEVLPKAEFHEEHLPHAIHLPLRRVDSEALTSLEVGRPLIVYCWDGL